MGDITLSLLDGKHRVAEYVFGWSRTAVEMGMNEHRSGITCVNDWSTRHKPRSEDKYPHPLAAIKEIMEPHIQAEPRLRTISNILNRQNYRLRTVEKTKVQKKQKNPSPYLKMSEK
jgi:hypothetical protein